VTGGGGDIGLAALALRFAHAMGAAQDASGGRRAGPVGLRRPIDLTRAIEAGTIAQSRLRELSPVVFAMAGEGDAVACPIVDRLADEPVMAGDDPTAVPRPPPPHGRAAGGVFRRTRPSFEARIRDGARGRAGADVHRSDALPVLGAALLGLDRLDGRVAGDRQAAERRLRAALGAWRP
jgi:N-acetylglucosamine kinase-like BadF-type ATPase